MILEEMEPDIPMDLTDESRPAPTSYAVDNYELFKTEIQKVQVLLESAHKQVATLDNEIDVNKGSLSPESEFAGEASAYFSNRLQSIGYNTIYTLMSTMYQLQSAVLHRYPEQRQRLGQIISYGELPSEFASSAAFFDRRDSSDLESADSSLIEEPQILRIDANTQANESEPISSEPELVQDASDPATDDLSATLSSTDASCVSTISIENPGEIGSVAEENSPAAAAPPPVSANEELVESSPMEVEESPAHPPVIEEAVNPVEIIPDPVPERRKRGRPKKLKPALGPEKLISVDPIYETQNGSQQITSSENACVNNPHVMLVNCLVGQDYEKLLSCPKLWNPNRCTVKMGKLGPSMLKRLKKHQYVILTDSGQILPGNREVIPEIAASASNNTENANVGAHEDSISIPEVEVDKSDSGTQQLESQVSEVLDVPEVQEKEPIIENTLSLTTEEELGKLLKRLKRINKSAGRPIVRRPKPQRLKPAVPRLKKKKPNAKREGEIESDLLNWVDMDEDATDELEPYNHEIENDESPVPSPPDVLQDQDLLLPEPGLESLPVVDEDEEDLVDLDQVESNDEERQRKLLLREKKKSDENPQPILKSSDVAKKKVPKPYTPKVVSSSDSDSDSDTTDNETKGASQKVNKSNFAPSVNPIDTTVKSTNEVNLNGDANEINDNPETTIVSNLTDEDSGDDCVVVLDRPPECVVVEHIPPKKNASDRRQLAEQDSLVAIRRELPALVTQLLKQREAPPVPYKKSLPLPSVTFLGEMPSPFGSKGRREIRPIKEEKAVETQLAEREEQQRLQALEESQKLQEELASVAPQRGLVLEFDIVTKDPLISVEKCLSDALKPHQEEGVRFLWSSCFGSVAAAPTAAGCVLAHLMGLGKSLQALTFVHTALSYQELTGVRSAIILCPMGIVPNWKRECQIWLGNAEYKVPVYTLSSIKAGVDLQQLMYWDTTGGIGILHYNAAASCFRVMRSTQKKLNSMHTEEQRAAHIKHVTAIETERIHIEKLLTKADILICDEGHVLKNPKTGFYKAVNKFTTQRRVILTGTPLQNNLEEYYYTVNLVKPNLLGSFKEFTNGFINPIYNGMHNDSIDWDVKLMKRRIYVLNEKLRGCVQRKDYGVLEQYLKPKHEFALLINLSDLQNNLYKEYLNMHKERKLLKDYMLLQKICAHPKLIYSQRYSSNKQRTKGGSRADTNEDEEDDEDEDFFEDGSREKWFDSVIPPSFRDTIHEEWGHSGKLVLLREIIQACNEHGDKLLIFSKFTYALNLIEEFLKQHCSGVWELGNTYFRIDGSIKPVTLRDRLCAEFNESPRARLFLLTQKAGGLGFNLHGANRVVLFDVSFNPSDDAQSVFRAYRMGQQKECYIYRFVSHGGMEETTYVRSILKLSLARRVVDEQQVERPFVVQDSTDVYRFTPSSCAKTKTASNLDIPNDDLLKNILVSKKEWVYNCIKPANLLKTGTEEELNDAEKTYAITEVLKKPVEKKQPKQKAVRQPGPRTSRLQHLPVFDHHDQSGKSTTDRLFEAMAEVNHGLTPFQCISIFRKHQNQFQTLTELSHAIELGAEDEPTLRNKRAQFDGLYRVFCEYAYTTGGADMARRVPASSAMNGEDSNSSSSNNSVIQQKQRGTRNARGRGRGRQQSGGPRPTAGLPLRTYSGPNGDASAAARRRPSQGEIADGR